ncbi:hypothetical protein GF362_01025 [Candidatus Dojkabacteria bacterium]|nr:hypothetical protein [Candidatus Dojkabacteria bacterium]
MNKSYIKSIITISRYFVSTTALFLIATFLFINKANAAIDGSIKITSPNGGEVYQKGDIVTIEWDSTENIDKVTLGYSRGPGSLSWIETSIDNTGSYEWDTSGMSSDEYLIDITGYETGAGSLSDQSDDYFTIQDNSSTPPGSSIFPDVPLGYKYYDAIVYAVENNIVSGYTDGTFKPERLITRGEFTKVMINAKFDENTINDCNYYDYSFPDVTPTYTFAKYICVAKRESIVSGYSDGEYKAERNIKFGEVSKIVSNAYGYTTGNVPSDDPNYIFKPYILELEERHAIPDSISSIEHKITRAEFVELIYRLDNNITNKSYKTFEELTAQVVPDLNWQDAKAWNEYTTIPSRIQYTREDNVFDTDIFRYKFEFFGASTPTHMYYAEDVGGPSLYIRIDDVHTDLTNKNGTFTESVTDNPLVTSIQSTYYETSPGVGTTVIKFQFDPSYPDIYNFAVGYSFMGVNLGNDRLTVKFLLFEN